MRKMDIEGRGAFTDWTYSDDQESIGPVMTVDIDGQQCVPVEMANRMQPRIKHKEGDTVIWRDQELGVCSRLDYFMRSGLQGGRK